MTDIEKVARAAKWLRECHNWLLANDYDMTCPMDEAPLDLAEELEAIAAMQPAPQEPVAWMYEIGGVRRVYETRLDLELPDMTETPLYAFPTPPAGGSDAER